MEDELRQELFNPSTAHRLVLHRRPNAPSAVDCVVSDLVWGEVVSLLRWATAATGGTASLESGRWWRLAASCADLLRRLPVLSDELDEPWTATLAVNASAEESASARVDAAAARLAGLLRSTVPVSLTRLGAHVDDLGAAAINALAEQSSWPVPLMS